jgi:hypothetical protein
VQALVPASQIKMDTPAPATPAPVAVVPAVKTTNDDISGDTIAKAPDAIRALGLALEDCDATALSFWIAFPLHAGAKTYDTPAALARACAKGDKAFSQASFDVSKLSTDLSGNVALPVGAATWHFEWKKGQWWLSSIE